MISATYSTIDIFVRQIEHRYFQQIGAALLTFLSTLFVAAPSNSAAAALVEVVLADRLDEPRGFCIDIVGSQQRAVPAQGLQAHSCYSYQGRIAVDQAFDADRMAAGQFQLPAFAVCLALPELRAEQRLLLQECDVSTSQRFDFAPDGLIVPRGAPELCLTVADSPSRRGGGGSPPHLIRKLSVEPCSPVRKAFQTWRTRSRFD